ncbi:tail fiber assembly protein, partial [Salmonella enterica]|uniref:tail fiber assembly protein n=1 Tax=Salmonella enterica TaxID=28901 RepID=UPI0021BE58FF
AEETKNRLLQIASEKIAPLQDAVDFGIATDDEKAQLNENSLNRLLMIIFPENIYPLTHKELPLFQHQRHHHNSFVGSEAEMYGSNSC